jgi:hypothetical protein
LFDWAYQNTTAEGAKTAETTFGAAAGGLPQSGCDPKTGLLYYATNNVANRPFVRNFSALRKL